MAGCPNPRRPRQQLPAKGHFTMPQAATGCPNPCRHRPPQPAKTSALAVKSPRAIESSSSRARRQRRQPVNKFYIKLICCTCYGQEFNEWPGAI